MEIKIMLKFDEQKQLDSVNGALALRVVLKKLLMLFVLKDTRISAGLALAVHGLLLCRLKCI